jgi:uncharacterized small protein (TIGR04563 family)
MSKPSGRKHSFCFPDWMSRELESEAARLDRSTSWIVQRAWKLARAEMARSERSRAPRCPDAHPAVLGYPPALWRSGTMPST